MIQSLLGLLMNNNGIIIKEKKNMALQFVSGSHQPKEGDVANGYYPHLKPIGINDPEFTAVVEWVKSKGAPEPRVLVSASALGSLLPTELVFDNGRGAVLRADAAMFFNFPHITLTELKNVFGFGDPKVSEYYTVAREPKPTIIAADASPIGEPLPQLGPNAFRPNDSDRLPVGTKWQGYTKELRAWAFFEFPVWIKN